MVHCLLVTNFTHASPPSSTARGSGPSSARVPHLPARAAPDGFLAIDVVGYRAAACRTRRRGLGRGFAATPPCDLGHPAFPATRPSWLLAWRCEDARSELVGVIFRRAGCEDADGGLL